MLVVLACMAFGPEVAASPTSWRVVARSADAGGGIAVAAAVVRRAGPLAIRVRASGQPQRVRVVAVIACSEGQRLVTRTTTYVLRTPALRVLRLPLQDPENCGVTAIGSAGAGPARPSGGPVGSRVEIEILRRE
jgi:hypothetical protein